MKKINSAQELEDLFPENSSAKRDKNEDPIGEDTIEKVVSQIRNEAIESILNSVTPPNKPRK